MYGALDRSRCLEILEIQGTGPRGCRILQTYWRRMTIMARAGGYYGVAFNGACGLTQVYPLSPTIFNVVVDVVVRHWLMVMVEGV